MTKKMIGQRKLLSCAKSIKLTRPVLDSCTCGLVSCLNLPWATRLANFWGEPEKKCFFFLEFFVAKKWSLLKTYHASRVFFSWWSCRFYVDSLFDKSIQFEREFVWYSGLYENCTVSLASLSLYWILLMFCYNRNSVLLIVSESLFISPLWFTEVKFVSFIVEVKSHPRQTLSSVALHFRYPSSISSTSDNEALVGANILNFLFIKNLTFSLIFGFFAFLLYVVRDIVFSGIIDTDLSLFCSGHFIQWKKKPVLLLLVIMFECDDQNRK